MCIEMIYGDVMGDEMRVRGKVEVWTAVLGKVRGYVSHVKVRGSERDEE